jgi:hypothetical protein
MLMTRLRRFIIMIEEQILISRELGFNPQFLKINEFLLGELSKDAEFWEVPQFKTEVTTTVRVLNKFKSLTGIVLEVVPDDNTLVFNLTAERW